MRLADAVLRIVGMTWQVVSAADSEESEIKIRIPPWVGRSGLQARPLALGPCAATQAHPGNFVALTMGSA